MTSCNINRQHLNRLLTAKLFFFHAGSLDRRAGTSPPRETHERPAMSGINANVEEENEQLNDEIKQMKLDTSASFRKRLSSRWWNTDVVKRLNALRHLCFHLRDHNLFLNEALIHSVHYILYVCVISLYKRQVKITDAAVEPSPLLLERGRFLRPPKINFSPVETRSARLFVESASSLIWNSVFSH